MPRPFEEFAGDRGTSRALSRVQNSAGSAVPEDHLVRKIDAALDLSWLRSELAPQYSSMGRPSIDPELMIRMLVVGYVFAIRSERLTILDYGRSLHHSGHLTL